MDLMSSLMYKEVLIKIRKNEFKVKLTQIFRKDKTKKYKMINYNHL